MSPPLRIGVLILPPVQLLDVSPVDLFYIADKEYLEICNLPRPITALGLNTTTTYIAASGPFAECTASAALRVTADLATPSVQPGKLDILFLPGPDPNSVPGEEEKAFIRSHADVGTSILSVCTASFALGHAGILKGRKATGPRSLLGKMREMFPDTEWVDKRWIQDREIWCSAGITNGQDMVAAYIRQRWPGPLANTVCFLADVGDRKQEYESSKTGESAWFIWQILRAWLRRFGLQDLVDQGGDKKGVKES